MRGERYEPLINYWSASNHEIMLPDNSMLMVYGLVPRPLHDGTVCWDDPYRPVYDVIRVRSHVDSNSQERGHAPVLVEMRRDYLSDYCSLIFIAQDQAHPVFRSCYRYGFVLLGIKVDLLNQQRALRLILVMGNRRGHFGKVLGWISRLLILPAEPP